eukprot:TRINITY_DN8633_c0_g1_i8.p1 TRINITY_DN8633_c0_g1~~TRINITY_DN8633_c0_g1_i8.p1  ORF type:complete len:311 (+),score=74.80 TRINITY_DN8633_c0_g1_i8:234-1166(+)
MEAKTSSHKLPIELPIYYGSQTGTASGFANDLAQEAIKYGVKPKVIDLADFNLNEFAKEKVSVFVVATYGRGGPTANAANFYKWLKSSENLEKDYLKDKEIAVFGCGDRGYKRFNQMAKDVADLLTARGARNICETGLGDAGEDIEGDFAAWRKSFWESFQAPCTRKENEEVVEVVFDPGEVQAANFSSVEFELSAKLFLEASNLLQPLKIEDIRILSMKELREDTTEGSTLMLELDGKASGLTYTAAQTVAIFPTNEETLVAHLAALQGWQLDQKFILKYKVAVPYPFPGVVTVREALARFCNLTGLLT